tara:strand:- start:35373 stop:36272 length:900 start_codon:yes stop_codon:yes gene_type:complete
MRHLNYNHLHYFWTVANEGSIVAASRQLHITPQTISGQIKLLEDAVGDALFQRVGRNLVLTDTGGLVKQYADDIFAVGAELSQLVRNGKPLANPVLNVGIVDSIPKLVAYRVLKPALAPEQDLRVVCREGDLETLLADLSVHRLDLLISDRPMPVGTNVKAYDHRLGESVVGLFSSQQTASRYRRSFPQSLDEAPMLLPLPGSTLRRDLEAWFESIAVRPHTVAEFDDSALLKVFGEAGAGIFPAPLAIASEVERMYSARLIGQIDTVKEAYLAISPERKLKHPVVVDIIRLAREHLFG